MLLALFFSLITLLQPADAYFCTDRSEPAESDCCAHARTTMPSMSEICCDMSSDATATVQPSASKTSESPCDAGAPIKFVSIKTIDFPQVIENASKRPLHLASNKIYLLKRSLLI